MQQAFKSSLFLRLAAQCTERRDVAQAMRNSLQESQQHTERIRQAQALVYCRLGSRGMRAIVLVGCVLGQGNKTSSVAEVSACGGLNGMDAVVVRRTAIRRTAIWHTAGATASHLQQAAPVTYTPPPPQPLEERYKRAREPAASC